jgi:hypothetical protein
MSLRSHRLAASALTLTLLLINGCGEGTTPPAARADQPAGPASAAAATTAATAPAAVPGTEIARCSFAGPYVAHGEHRLQQGCINNWVWGRKTLRLSEDRDAGRPGSVQRIEVVSLSSGAMQFWCPPPPFLARGKFYRVSFWMKAEGVGKVGAQIRKVGNPWTSFVPGITIEQPAATWTRYEFSGECSTDVDRDHGVLIETADVGTLWLDDVVVEELAGDPTAQQDAAQAASAMPGNLLPRTSFEAVRDPLWCGGVYGDPDGEFEDPQPHRVAGGLQGGHCLALPASTRGGTSFLRSAAIPVAPGSPYTASLWLRATVPGTTARLGLNGLGDPAFAADKSFRLDGTWRRCAVTTAALPPGARKAVVTVSLPSGQAGEVLLDAAQVEMGAAPTAWTPRFPLDLGVAVSGGGDRLFTWDEQPRLALEAWPVAGAGGGPLAAEVEVVGLGGRPVLQQAMQLIPGTTVELALPAGLRGLQRATLRSTDPALAAPIEALFAVLPPPRALGAAGSFGAHFSVRPATIDYARRLGYSWIRLHDGSSMTKWGVGEPEPGKFRWFDPQVDALRNAGFAILGLPDAPNWPKHQQRDGKPAFDPAAYGRWCQAAAEHYRGRIDHWEIWNEPYMSYFFPGTVEQYGAMAAAGIAGLRQGNPAAKILGFCNELNHGEWKKPLPAELKRGVDFGSFHYYQGNLAGDGEGLRAQVAEYAATFGPGGPGEHWNSEGGQAHLGGNSFYTQFGDQTRLNTQAAAYAARVLIEHRAANVRSFHYTLHQADTIIYHGGYKMMVGYDRSPTPAGVANAVAAWCLDGQMAVPLPAAAPEGLVQGLFTGRGRATWTIFHRVPGRGAQTVLDLDALPAGALVLDLHGADPRQRGLHAWTVDESPLFVVQDGADVAALARACLAALRAP